VDLILWGIASVLAIFYVFAGGRLLIVPVDELPESMGWARDTPTPVVKLIALVEIAGAVALLVPQLLQLAVVVTVVAAFGFALLQAVAIVVHLRRGERGGLWVNAVLLLLALALGIGRAVLPG
jgi:hypothetical protein